MPNRYRIDVIVKWSRDGTIVNIWFKQHRGIIFNFATFYIPIPFYSAPIFVNTPIVSVHAHVAMTALVVTRLMYLWGWT